MGGSNRLSGTILSGTILNCGAEFGLDASSGGTYSSGSADGKSTRGNGLKGINLPGERKVEMTAVQCSGSFRKNTEMCT